MAKHKQGGTSKFLNTAHGARFVTEEYSQMWAVRSCLNVSGITSVAASTINAKLETAATKLAFCDPLKLRRCLIPADAFYERKKVGNTKPLYCFKVNDCQWFVLSGDGGKDSSGLWVKTSSILTTTQNAVTSSVHDRMPVKLDRNRYDLWLDPRMQDLAATSELLKPYDPSRMRCFSVRNLVNYVGNDDEEWSRPIMVADTQDRLFA